MEAKDEEITNTDMPEDKLANCAEQLVFLAGMIDARQEGLVLTEIETGGLVHTLRAIEKELREVQDALIDRDD